MTVFWLIAAAASVAVVAALLPALLRAATATRAERPAVDLHATRLEELRRDTDDGVIDASVAATAETEITRALLEETQIAESATPRAERAAPWTSALLVAVFVPAFALSVYYQLGRPQYAADAARAADAAGEAASIEALLAALEQRLADNPDSAEGWVLLGRSYMALSRYDDAVNALGRAYALVGAVPGVMLQYADAKAMAAGGRIGPDVRELVDKVLELEADNVAALWLAGLGAAETGDHAAATAYLERARAAAAAAGQSTHELDEILRGLGAAPTQAAPSAPVALTAHVGITEALRTGRAADETVYVFARAPGDAGPPLAATRLRLADLPATVTLDQSMAMTPMFRLEGGASVTVTARVSQSGNPVAAPGDVEGHSPAVVVGEDTEVSVLIDARVE